MVVVGDVLTSLVASAAGAVKHNRNGSCENIFSIIMSHLRMVVAVDDIAMENDFDMEQNNNFVSLVHTSTYLFCFALFVSLMALQGAKCHCYYFFVTFHRPNISLGQELVACSQMSDLSMGHPDQQASICHCNRLAEKVLDLLFYLRK